MDFDDLDVCMDIDGLDVFMDIDNLDVFMDVDGLDVFMDVDGMFSVAGRSAVHPASEPAAAAEGWTAEDRNADRRHNLCPTARGPQQAGGRQLHRRASLHRLV